MSRSSTITELIRIGKTKNLTYYNTSLLERIGHIECSTKNIFLDYIDELLQSSVVVTLTDKEYYKYLFRPKILAYDIYGDTDLYFLIMLINNINSEKDFNLRTLKLIPPTNMDIIHSIYNTENKFLYRFNDENGESSNEIFNPDSLRSISSFEIKQKDNINTDLIELRYELDNIKTIIRDILKDLITDDLDQIMLDLIISEVEKIKNSITSLVTSQIDQILNDHNIINRISFMENEISNIQKALNAIMELDLDNRITVLEEKSLIIKNRIDLLENSLSDIINEGIKDEVDSLIKEFNTFKDQILQLIENGPSLELDGILDEIQKLKDSLSKLSGVSTRDIVFIIQTPVTAGIQQDTEFFVPYKGQIEQIIMSVGVDTKLTSNLIILLQKYSISKAIWETISIHEMDASDKYRIQDVSMPINTEYIRLVLDAGDYDNVSTGINFIIRIQEDKEKGV